MNQDVTLYRIIKLFEDYQQSQTNIGLNGFGYGNLIDFGQNLTGGTQTQYPFMFVTPQNISYDENITTYTMSIIFADRLNDDKSNMVDVQSDMSIQAKRLMGWVKRGMDKTPDLFDNMDINLPTAGIPFLERFNDYVGGIAIDLEVVVQESIDSCSYYPTEIPEPITFYIYPYNFQSTNQDKSYWYNVFPDLLITNERTGDVTRVKSTTFSDDSNCDIYPTRATGDTTAIQFITGSTDVIRVEYDQTQVQDYGYYPIKQSNFFSGLTYSNFGPSPVPAIPNSYGYTRTEYRNDGSVSVTDNQLLITNNFGNPLPVGFGLTGDTIPMYKDNLYGYTASTFNDACNFVNGSNTNLYLTYPEGDFWNYSGDTLDFSMTECIKTRQGQDFYVSKLDGGITHIASGNTWGYLTYLGTCP